MLNKLMNMRTKKSELGVVKKIYLFLLIASLLFLVLISLASAGNYKFQNTTGSTLFFINGSTAKIGIGTSTPFSLFEVGKASGTNEVNLSGVVYVNSTSGNVGIGTTSPSAKLQVNGTGVLLNIKNQSNTFMIINETSGDIKIGV